MSEPHDERMNAYYVSAYKGDVQTYSCYEGEVVFHCCVTHLREQLKREGHERIKIRRARDWERVFMRR
jgi:hypothetical protein